MPSRTVRFDGAMGTSLAGILDLPDGPAQGYALFAHCFTCSKHLRIVHEVGRALNAAGLGLLRFDFTGLGQSEGRFAQTTFQTNLDDLVAAAEWMVAQDQAPSILVGHSLGGAAALAAAGRIPHVRAVATIAAPSHPRHVEHLLDDLDWRPSGVAEINLGGATVPIGRAFLDDLGRHDLGEEVASLGRPLLIFHSPHDPIVPIRHAEALFKAARHPKSFISLGAADHLVSNTEDARFVGRMIAAWATGETERPSNQTRARPEVS